jgi:hypothetical protein
VQREATVEYFADRAARVLADRLGSSDGADDPARDQAQCCGRQRLRFFGIAHRRPQFVSGLALEDIAAILARHEDWPA